MENNREHFPEISINPIETFASKLSPIFHSDIIDVKTQEKIGTVYFKIKHRSKEITIDHVLVYKPKQGHGVSLYRKLQSMYPEYTLVSSEQMTAKEDSNQEHANAIYLWEKLVRLGDAEKISEGVYRMKKL